MALWNAELFQKGQQLGMFEEGDRLIAGFTQGVSIDLESISESALQLSSLICSVLDNNYKSDLQAMALDIGFKPEVAKLMKFFQEKIIPESFARIDMYLEPNGGKFLEFNMGSLTGGMQYASLPRLSGFSQENDVLKSWALEMKDRYIDENSLTIFLVDESIVELIRYQLSIFSQALQQETGSEVIITGPRSLSWDGCQLKYQGRRVDNIYCRFEQDQLLSQPEDYRDFLSALEKNAVNCPLGLGYNIVASKGVWAMLWKLHLSKKLSPQESVLVEKHLPYTFWLTGKTYQQAIEKKHTLVLKPTDGYAGRDVVCGREMSDQKWTQTLLAALTVGDKSFVLQEYIEPEPMSVGTYDANGNLEENTARVVWGIYIFGKKYLGGFLRSLPTSGTAVINYSTGAALGPMMKTTQ